MNFPDIEAVLVSWLTDAIAGVHACTELPGNLDSVLPAIHVTRIGGADKSVRLDRPLVDLDCFDVDKPSARALCEEVRHLMQTEFHGDVGGAVVVLVQTVQGPHRRPYNNTTLRRYGATFRITDHS